MSALGTMVSDLKKAGEYVKTEVMKIAGDAPAIVAVVAKDEAAIAPVLEAFIPGASGAISLANSLLDLVAQSIEDAGTAASSNGISVSLDKTVVADVQAVITAAKAAAAKV